VTEIDRFLELAALELIRRDGVRLIRGPRANADSLAWTPGWNEWDQVLVGDGPGVQPAVYVFARGEGLEETELKHRVDRLAEMIVTSSPIRRGPTGAGIRMIVILTGSSLNPSDGRGFARTAPSRYYAQLKPEVYAVDISHRRVFGTRIAGLFPSRVTTALKQALQDLDAGAVADEASLLQAQRSVASERERFVSTLRRNVPYVTYSLLALIWAVFALEAFYPAGLGATRTLLHFGALQPVLVERGEWWLLLSAMFVHVNFIHILFNSVALYSIGTLVERIYGPYRYAAIYFVSGILASLASFVFMLASGQPHEVAAGASGAIFGIAGVVIVLGVQRNSVVPRPVAVQLSVFMLALIVLNIAFDAFSPQIDIRAHIGGLVVGMVMGYVLAPKVPDDHAGRVISGHEALHDLS